MNIYCCKKSALATLLAVVVLLVSGCGIRAVDTSYGRTRDQSINGTGTLVELFKAQGHTVRTAVRLSDELAGWADVIVRISPYPGPPEKAEGDWYFHWLSQIGERQMIYVARDYDALADYWQEVRDQLPKGGDQELRARAEKLRAEAAKGDGQEGSRPKEVARPEEWFAVNTSKDPGTTCKSLEGFWSQGIDPDRVRLPRHETLKVESESVLLEGDEKPLVIDWTLFNDSRVLVAANGSFLLNGALLNPARRPLAMRAVQWVGDEPLNVAFVEGRYLLNDAPAAPSVFALLKIWPFGWVVAQLMILGLVACLARAPRLGRPRPEPPSGEDRPVAHPEAIGALLARIGQAGDARALLETYRRWRYPSSQTRVGPTPASPLPLASVDSTEKPFQPESLTHE
ncbi:DUF4350 domain-containing protein [Singulisphaera acidiphila]|uniref:DUF4350 domain-containing protein n=1 Tax=Singulisphaera acidiphila (strain ATCC BAA-1392 / DSM 18658 / VKM B-2454 / MOB10) TaxID=886293 RepID=L0DMM5_SINAD|nr:DUF4350 domain-containing protein [Singulisphaera acidiphila]AGA30507.1 hypothetical protein Sinac_6427 [Singulisphaera acidiphila DSM 18658]